jgi:hypothetical protein
MNHNQKNKFLQLVNKVKNPPHGALATKMSNRFQDQPWYIKLWRYRWYIRVPYDTMNYWRKGRFHNGELGLCYSMAMGEAHLKMNWIYTLEEVREMALQKSKRKK